MDSIANIQNLFFLGFLAFVMLVLLIDLGILSKKSQDKVSSKEAAAWTAVWVSCALLFWVFLRNYGQIIHGIDDMEGLKAVKEAYQLPFSISDNLEQTFSDYRKTISLQFITGYLIEYSLSADNLFVILLIFSSFNVPEKHYKRVLLWGVLGAIVLRFIFIFLGGALINSFSWTLYLFGGFLVYSGVMLLIRGSEDEKIDTENHPMVKFTSRFFSVYPNFIRHYFMVKKGRKRMVTPLFVVLMVVEFSDLIFAVDSVPAIFGITRDPYIVFFSNIFAIMGLRSLFFLLSNLMPLFRYLKYGLAVILVFIGLKMFFEHQLHEIGFSHFWSLAFIGTTLSLSIALSIFMPEKKNIRA